MKIGFILTLFCVIQLQASLYSQSTKFNLKFNDATLREVLREVENRSEFRFFYSDDLLFMNKKITFKSADLNVHQILDMLLADSHLTYKVFEDNLIIITPLEQPGQGKVTGKVTDAQTGEPVPGVNIYIEGTTKGTITASNGEYSLEITDPDAVLIFSFIGYISQRIIVGDQTVINMSLSVDFTQIEELVVVGYGTQRAGNITGSISKVKGEDISRVSTPTVSQTLQGLASGVFIKNANAQPGENKTSINIRGFGTPLYIVDGNPVSQTYFQELNPNDIEQLNILKDAAAGSVYGARAGNGVIIVQTKRGKTSAPQFNFKSEAVAQFLLPNAVPNVVNSYEQMELYNMMNENDGLAIPYSRELIELHRQYADGSNPEYPNVNMYDELYRDYTPMYQNALSARGGTENVKYYLSANWLNQSGVEKSDETKFNRYTLRSNIDVALTKKFNLGFDLSFSQRDFIGPRNQMEGESWAYGQSHYMRARRWYPFWSIDPLPNPDFLTGAPSASSVNPINATYIKNVGYRKWKSQYSNFKINLGYDLPFGFTTKVIFNYALWNYDYARFQKRAPEYNYNSNTDEYTLIRYINNRDELLVRNETSNNMNLQYFLEWRQVFGDNHNLNGTLVAEYLSNGWKRIEASRHGYDVDIDQLFAGPDENQFNNSSASEGGRVGYIGRLAYNYAGKYFLEANSRIDGSPLFPPEGRWGIFPSVSASWLISKEPFITNIAALSFLNSLRLRASYGRLGYDAAGAFQYLATFRFASPYIPSGTTLQRGIRTDAIPNPNITWEIMDLGNIGLEFNLWNGILEGSVDVFQRDRKNVLGSRIVSLPNVIGASMPQENYQKFQNKGIEVMLNHSHKIGEVRYGIGGNISYNQQKTIFTDQPVYVTKEIERRSSKNGRYTNLIWRYPSDGLFKSQEEINSWADIDGRNNASIQPGDVRYVDTNGDGRITAEDMIIVGHGNMPRITYGINTSLAWKGFEVFMVWQGAGLFGFNLGTSEYISATGGTPLMHHLNDSYVPEGNQWRPANTDARWPLIRRGWLHNAGKSYASNLQHWWIDGSYLRLKQLQLNYTVPKHLTNRLGIGQLRIFVAGYNLITISELDWIDPEIDTSPIRHFGEYHPQMGSYHFGIDLNF